MLERGWWTEQTTADETRQEGGMRGTVACSGRVACGSRVLWVQKHSGAWGNLTCVSLAGQALQRGHHALGLEGVEAGGRLVKKQHRG